MKPAKIGQYQFNSLNTTRDRAPTPEFCNSSPRQQKSALGKTKGNNSVSQSQSITVDMKYGLRGSNSHSSGYFKNILRSQAFSKPSGRNISHVQFRYETLNTESSRDSPLLSNMNMENLSSRRRSAALSLSNSLKPLQSTSLYKKVNMKKLNGKSVSNFAAKKRELTPIKAEPESTYKENIRRTPPLVSKNINIQSPTSPTSPISSMSPLSPRFEIVDDVTPKNSESARIDKFTFQGTMTHRSSTHDIEGNCTSRFPGLFENLEDVGSFCEVNLLVAQEKPGIIIKLSQSKNLISNLRNF